MLYKMLQNASSDAHLSSDLIWSRSDGLIDAKNYMMFRACSITFYSILQHFITFYNI